MTVQWSKIFKKKSKKTSCITPSLFGMAMPQRHAFRGTEAVRNGITRGTVSQVSGTALPNDPLRMLLLKLIPCI